MNIYLIGLPGSGKSTVAKKLAQKLNKKFIDLDAHIEENALMFIDEIFERYGEKTFRKLESEALENIQGEDAIVACGGGIVTVKENKRFFNGPIVYLDVRLETIKSRLKNDYLRPILRTKTLENIYDERFLKYQSFADFNVSNDQNSDETVETIMMYLEEEGRYEA